MMIRPFQRWALSILLTILLSLFFYFQLYHYLSFESLKEHRQLLLTWSEQHTFLTALGFIGIYILIVACSIPGSTFLTLTSGFLFGPWLGTLWVVISATLGSCILFLAVQLALRNWMALKTSKWLHVMKQGFQQNVFSYLLFLRLVPLFPFWLVNIIPAMLDVSKRTFVLATLLGIIPGSFIYVLVGHSLGHLLDANNTPNLKMVFDAKIFMPLLALGLLALVPAIYKIMRHR